MRRILILPLLLLAPGLAAADPTAFGKAKLTVDLPAGWKVTADKEVTTARTADGTTTLLAWEGKPADAAAVQRLVKTVIADAAFGDKSDTEQVNGLSVVLMEGEGTAAGTKMKIGGLYVVGPGKEYGIVLVVFADVDGRRAHKKEIMTMLKSIAPVK